MNIKNYVIPVAAAAFMACGSHQNLEAQGFDYIGNAETVLGNQWFTATEIRKIVAPQMRATVVFGTAAARYTPQTDEVAKTFSAAIVLVAGINGRAEPEDVDDFYLEVWSSFQAFLQNRQFGDLLNFVVPTPLEGDGIASVGQAQGGANIRIVSFDLSALPPLRAGQEYLFALRTRSVPLQLRMGIVASDRQGLPSDVYAVHTFSNPGYRDLNALDSNYTKFAYKLSSVGTSFLLGDMNCDGVFNADDVDPFVEALVNLPEYQTNFPDCRFLNGDINQDQLLNNFDIDPFVNALANIGPAALNSAVPDRKADGKLGRKQQLAKKAAKKAREKQAKRMKREIESQLDS